MPERNHGRFGIFSVDKTSMEVFVVTVFSSLVGFHVASHRCALLISRSATLPWMLCPLVI